MTEEAGVLADERQYLPLSSRRPLAVPGDKLAKFPALFPKGGLMRPLAIDLYCGLGGWTEGLLACGFEVLGFDIERHEYGEHRYPAQLVLQDVRTLHGRQFKDAALIVGSSPCQEFSWRAMPWKKAKAAPPPYLGIELFEAQFRIQREASEAAGRHIPMVVENVRGAQKWVGRSRWNYGSFHFWGDVPALMPMVRKHAKVGGLDWSKYGQADYKTSGAAGCFRDSALKNPGFRFDGRGKSFQSESVERQVNDGIKNCGGSWFRVAHNTLSGTGRNPHGRNDPRENPPHTPHMTNPAEHQDLGFFTTSRLGENQMARRYGSKSSKRKMASALIAKIPEPVALHIARTFLPKVAPQ